MLADALASLKDEKAACLVRDYASRIGKISCDFDGTIGRINRITVKGSGHIWALGTRCI